jgi:Protein of unknown function (DUF2924)
MRKRGNSASRAVSVEGQIAQLGDLDLPVLRACWHNEFGRIAPKHLNRFLLFRVLAYKIQADRFGDLDADTIKVLQQAGGSEGRPAVVAKSLTALDERRFVPPPGTVLVREWDRKSHRVVVMPEGFSWNGKTFDSLSQIAFAITGTKWNGPRFFGLRDRQSRTSIGANE